MEKPKINMTTKIDFEKEKEIEDYLIKNSSVWVDIELNWAFMTIEKRPPYCDRGRYSLMVSHKPEHFIECYIDAADGFARYYFNFDCLIKEINSFIDFRKLEIKHIFLRKPT